MTLPGLDLTPLVTAINNNTAMMQNIVDELVRMNEDKDTKIETLVNAHRQRMEEQYRTTIENLEKLVPNVGHSFPHFPGPIGGGLGSAPGTASPQ